MSQSLIQTGDLWPLPATTAANRKCDNDQIADRSSMRFRQCEVSADETDDPHQAAALWHVQCVCSLGSVRPNPVQISAILTRPCVPHWEPFLPDRRNFFSQLFFHCSVQDALNKTSDIYIAININIYERFPHYCRDYFPLNIPRRAVAGRASIIKHDISFQLRANKCVASKCLKTDRMT